MPGVCAVVLTYNRRDLLRKCLASITQQSAPCDHVIVVDNGSADGTSDMLRSEYPWVELCQTHTNSGAAGGFNLAMRLAIAGGAAHVWAMDDDVFPEPDALERLKEALAFLEGEKRSPPFVLSVARAPSGKLTNVPDVDRSRNELEYQNWPIYLDKCLVPVRRSTFVSILLPARTFERNGFPLAEMFIWGEDGEFTMRVTKTEPGFVCGTSKVVHARALEGKLSIGTETSSTRLKWHKYATRNAIYSLRKHASRAALLRRLAETLGYSARLAFQGKLREAGILMRGIVAGLTFRPHAMRSVQQQDLDIAYLSPSLHSRIVARSLDHILEPVSDRNAFESKSGKNVLQLQVLNQACGF